MKIIKDHKYSIDYQTNGDNNCQESGCNDEGICRCFTIESVNIYSINLNSVRETIFKDLFDVDSIEYKRDVKIAELINETDITEYGIDRLLSIYNLFSPDEWESEWSGNYYGEEVDSINIVRYRELALDIEKFLTLPTLKERVEFLLIKEYGQLLPKIVDKNYEVIVIDKSDIIFGMLSHKKIVVRKNNDYYLDKNHTIDIKGVCLKEGDKYRVIDGYHRLSSTMKNKVRIINIFS